MQIQSFARIPAIAVAALSLFPGLAGAQALAKADLIVVNGNVYTVDDARPQASAFAVRNGRIVFVGSDREARFLAGASTRVIDARGRTVIPGMVDAHAHLLGLGTSLRNVQLAGSKSYDESPANGFSGAAGIRISGRTRNFRLMTH
jgi:imidazolonepropionase-like amidohydrolase